MQTIQQVRTESEDPLFVINLDLPHFERWKEVITAKRDILKSFAENYRKHVNITQEQAESFVTYGKAFPEAAKNLEAISILSGVDLPTLYTYNFMYDIESMGCTSVIIRKPDNNIFHARNLDYSFQEEISQIAIRAHWVKGGKIIYKSETLVGFVSLITVTKIGKFSVSINYRRPSDSNQDNINALIQKFYIQAIQLPQLVVDTANSYEEAVEIFKTVYVSANIYFIVSGLEGNQGTVIERDRTAVNNVYTLSENVWYLVQTNTDRSKTNQDYRFNQTVKNIESLGQENCTKENILKQVMSVFPTKNTETISTSLYSAYDGDFISRNYLLNKNNEQIIVESS